MMSTESNLRRAARVVAVDEAPASGFVEPRSPLEVSRRAAMAAWCRRHDTLVVGTILLLSTVIAYPDAFLRLEAIAPGDLLFFHTPWAHHVPPDMVVGANPVLSDQVDFFIPQIEYVRQCLKRGEIPFWCDKLQNGTPYYLVIRHELMVLPMTISVLLFKTPLGMNLYFVLRHLLGGLFFYKYVRLFELNRWASLCGALVFCYGKYAVQDFIFPMYLELMLLPMTAYGIERIIRDRSVLWCALTPLFLLTNILSGFPAGTAYCLYFLALYAAFRVLGAQDRRLLLSGILVAVFLVPILWVTPAIAATADFFSHFDWSYRTNFWSWRLPLASLETWLYPFFYGPPYLGGTPIVVWYEFAFYIGALPLFVLLPSLLRFRSTAVRWFYLVFAAWLVVLLYNVGNVLEHVIRHLPVLSSNPNTRQKLLLEFVLPVLLVFALDDLAYGRLPRSWRRAACLLLVPLIGWAAWRGWTQYGAHASSIFVPAHLLIQSTVLAVSLAVLCVLRWRDRAGPWIKAVVALLVFADLQLMDKGWYPLARREHDATRMDGKVTVDQRMAVGWNPTIPRPAYFLKTPAVSFLKANIGDDKMLTIDSTFLPATPLFYDLNQFGGRGLFQSRAKGLYRLVNEYAVPRDQPTGYLFESSRRTRVGAPIIDALGIKYVVLDSRAKLEHLTRDYLIKQPEWNDTATLLSGQSLRQSFRAPRRQSIDRCEIRCTENALRDPADCRVQISDTTRDTTYEPTSVQWNDSKRTLECAFEPFFVNEGESHGLSLTVPPDNLGTLTVLCTQQADVLRSGTLTVADVARKDGDLTFSLFAQAEAALDKYRVVYEDEVCILENTKNYGRAWLAGGLRYGTADQVREALSVEDGDLRECLWVEEDMRAVAGPERPLARVRGTVTPVELRSSYQRFETDSQDDGYLVVSDNHDAGWRAFIDGVETGVFRVDYNLRAISLPKGRHVVEFRYRPPYFFASFGVTALAALVYAMFLMRLRRVSVPPRRGASTIPP